MTLCKLDIDRPRPPRLPRLLWALRRLALPAPVWVQYARSRRGWHVTLALPMALPPVTLVALQAVLGSDPTRELFNLARARAAPRLFQRYGNVLFDRKIA